jgi:hypothetical protein
MNLAFCSGLSELCDAHWRAGRKLAVQPLEAVVHRQQLVLGAVPVQREGGLVGNDLAVLPRA